MSITGLLLKEFADNGNSRTFELAGHTALDTRILVQKRTLAGNTGVLKDTFRCTGTVRDAVTLEILPQVASVYLEIRRPVATPIGDPSVIHTLHETIEYIMNSSDFEDTLERQSFVEGDPLL